MRRIVGHLQQRVGSARNGREHHNDRSIILGGSHYPTYLTNSLRIRQ